MRIRVPQFEWKLLAAPSFHHPGVTPAAMVFSARQPMKAEVMADTASTRCQNPVHEFP